MLALMQSLASKNKRCDLLLRLTNLHPEGSVQRKDKMEEVEKVLEDITQLETKMETYSQTAKRLCLAAVDSLLAATMNTPLADAATSLPTFLMPGILDTGLVADNAGAAATIKV
jgi:Mg2+ and Co2+ transporter CorA